jgi:hypothetical protein
MYLLFISIDVVDLNHLSAKELREMCTLNGIQVAASATKATLQRALEKPSSNGFYIEKVFIRQWFLKPFKTNATKMGSENEPYVLKALPSFLRDNSSYSVLKIREYGLLAK